MSQVKEYVIWEYRVESSILWLFGGNMLQVTWNTKKTCNTKIIQTIIVPLHAYN